MSEKNSRQEKRGWTESGGEKNEHREGDEWEFNGLRKTGMNKKRRKQGDSARQFMLLCRTPGRWSYERKRGKDG